MPRVLIIGYGNPLRGDDGLGWHAAGRLRQLLNDPEVEILVPHQLTPELSELASRAEEVIFVDASAEGEPGELAEREIRPAAGPARAFTHQMTPEGVLEMAETLYGRRPAATMFSIAGESFAFGSSLSDRVAARIPELLERIVARCGRRQ